MCITIISVRMSIAAADVSGLFGELAAASQAAEWDAAAADIATLLLNPESEHVDFLAELDAHLPKAEGVEGNTGEAKGQSPSSALV